jgi:nitrate/TMAO reductase-like tetraheme cytochrome c subunit
MTWKLVVAAPTVAVALLGTAAAQEGAAAAQVSPYVGAEACKECHAPYYEAWHGTKHANAINRLSAEEKTGGQCIGCHATGTTEQLAAEGANPSLPGVQCEACHGPGRTHVDSAKAGTPKPGDLARKPAEKTCVQCHNEKSPHFRGFFYSALAPLVHPVKK